jgi:hypothetical protein
MTSALVRTRPGQEDDMTLELDPEIAKVAQPWLDKILSAALKALFEKCCAEIPGMKEKDAQRILEYTLANMIKAWGDHRAMMVQYSKIFDNMPFLGDPPPDSGRAMIEDLMAQEVRHFCINYPIQSIGLHLGPPKPITCSICGKTQCEHLQTIMNSVRVADSEVIDALFQEDDPPEGEKTIPTNGERDGG